ncbi:MAG: SpoIIE family protein phosphatase [Phycisphaerales bacterium]|nr:SpoIIE family protein phosphatase [Phycisphaerales bacterium]
MTGRRLTIADFLTDGILARICDSAATLAGADVTLHDLDGRRIVHTDDERRWRICDAAPEDHMVHEAIQRGLEQPVVTGPGGETIFVLRVYDLPSGAIVVRGGDPAKRALCDEFAGLIAEKVSQFCDRDARLQDRHSELAVLFRLSSLLVGARGMGSILSTALTSVIDVLGMDAGIVHLLDVRTAEYDIPAVAGLDPDFVEALNHSSRFQKWLHRDIRAKGGVEVTTVEEGDAADLTRAGIVSAVSAALRFKGRHLGTLHLFTRNAREFESGEMAMLRIIGEQVALAVTGAEMAQIERQHRQVQRQVQLAAAVQRRMLPNHMPTVSGLDIAARYESCFELGGDLYDFLELGSSVGFVVGDVVGKGVPAALLMASVRATLRAHAADMYHLDDIMTLVNMALTRDTRDNEFATVFYGVLDPASLMLTYCNAGHEPPIILRRRTDTGAWTIESLLVSGLPLGIEAGAAYDRQLCRLRRGDILIAMTDGVMDALNFDDERFGRERVHESLLTFLAGNPDADARAIIDHVIWDMRRFRGLRAETDDATVVAIRVG